MTTEQKHLADRVDAIAKQRAKTPQGPDYCAIFEEVAEEHGITASEVARACAQAWAPMGAV